MRRLTGALGTPIILGVFLQVLFGFLYLAYRQGTISRFIMRLAVPLFVVLNVMTFTRSVWLGAILSYMYLAYKASEETKIKFVRVLAPAAFAVMLIGVLMAVSPDVQSRISGEENANFRVVMAQASLYMIADSPVMGWGQGTFDEHADRYLFDARGVYIVSDTSHVTLLTILAELGIVGFTLYLLFIMLNLKPRGITSSDMSRGDGEIIAVMRGTFIAFAVNALLIDMRFYSLAYSWFFVSLGVITNIYRENLSQREGEA